MDFTLLFGGASFEHEISIVSAITLKKLLGAKNFVFLDTDHTFYLVPEDKMTSKFFSSGAYKKAAQIYPKNGGFFTRGLMGEKRVELPLLLNLIHGGDGEDGALAALLEFFGIPFIGPRRDACVVSIDKELTKLFAACRGVKTLPYQVLYRGGTPIVPQYPAIIKPARLGSSLGISVINSQNELEYALDTAFEFDSKVIIEPFFAGIKEYNLAGFAGKNGLEFSIIEEPQKGDYLDFEKKYLDFSRDKNIAQANTSDELAGQLKAAFERLYSGTFDGALIRCDFFVLDGEILLNEINPIPGSLANYLFSDFSGALDALASALPRTRTITTNYPLLHKIQFAKGK